MKITKLTSFAIATIALGFVTINTDQATAVTLTYDITVNNLGGSLSGNEFTGNFSFDDAALVGTSSEFISVSDLSFNFQGVTFTENDDSFANAGIEFFNGEFLGLSYSTDVQFSFAPGFFSSSESFFAYDLGSGDVGTGDITYTLRTSPNPIPEPATIIGLLTTAILGNSLRKN